MTPIVNGLEAEFSGQITVLRLDAVEEENEQLMQVYGVRGHPSFVLLSGDGRVSQTLFGPQEEADLRAAMQLLLE